MFFVLTFFLVLSSCFTAASAGSSNTTTFTLSFSGISSVDLDALRSSLIAKLGQECQIVLLNTTIPNTVDNFASATFHFSNASNYLCDTTLLDWYTDPKKRLELIETMKNKGLGVLEQLENNGQVVSIANDIVAGVITGAKILGYTVAGIVALVVLVVGAVAAYFVFRPRPGSAAAGEEQVGPRFDATRAGQMGGSNMGSSNHGSDNKAYSSGNGTVCVAAVPLLANQQYPLQASPRPAAVQAVPVY